jgi:hypothetical protein
MGASGAAPAASAPTFDNMESVKHAHVISADAVAVGVEGDQMMEAQMMEAQARRDAESAERQRYNLLDEPAIKKAQAHVGHRKDPVEQIHKLKELLDLGAITQAQFEEKRNALLSLM